MARTLTELHDHLMGLQGVDTVYIQQPTSIKTPCITAERDDSYVLTADNIMYRFIKRYTITVIDRKPDSVIPDQVEALRYSRFDRHFTVDGLHHWVFQLYF